MLSVAKSILISTVNWNMFQRTVNVEFLYCILSNSCLLSPVKLWNK